MFEMIILTDNFLCRIHIHNTYCEINENNRETNNLSQVAMSNLPGPSTSAAKSILTRSNYESLRKIDLTKL